MRFEKKLEKRFVTQETRFGLKNLKQDYEKTKLVLVEELRRQKQAILDEAKIRPEILDYNPDIIEDLKTGKGLDKFLRENNISLDLIDDKYFNVPEMNKIILDYDENSGFTYTENYFNGFWNEDKLRYETHINLVREFERFYEGDIDEMVEINEIHIAENSKKSMKEYIQHVRTDEFKEFSTSYAKTLDNYRVDIGLKIERPPIFLG